MLGDDDNPLNWMNERPIDLSPNLLTNTIRT